MTEEEKLDAGLEYDFWDAGVNGRKLNAIKFCRELRKMQDADATEAEQEVLIRQYFGAVGRDVCLCPGFMCDSGKNIYVGDQFLTNYNVTILDIMPVHIGDYVMIGPNTLITSPSFYYNSMIQIVGNNIELYVANMRFMVEQCSCPCD